MTEATLSTQSMGNWYISTIARHTPGYDMPLYFVYVVYGRQLMT